MKFEVAVDRERCIGSGQCVHVAPKVFDQDEDAISVVVDPRGEPEEKVVRAVLGCPVQAIVLTVGDARLGPDDLKDWTHGAISDHPVVEQIGQLGDDHDELRRTIAELVSDATDERISHVRALARAHLVDEARCYEAVDELVEPALLDAFRTDLARLERSIEQVTAASGGQRGLRRTLGELVRAIEVHMRREEAILYPAALAAVASARAS